MILLILFAFLAGILTVFSPCVFPVLPIIFSGSVAEGKRRPFGIIAGFLASFVSATLLLTLAVRSFGIDPEILRALSALIFIVMALILLLPALKRKFMAAVGSLVSRSQSVKNPAIRSGFIPGFITGLGLGIVWTPCVGPIMASVISLAVSQSVDSGAFFITASYALGTSVPLLGVMLGGRLLVSRLSPLTGHLETIQRVFGALVFLTGIALLTGWDRKFQTWMLDTFPSYGAGLTALEDIGAVRSALEKRRETISGSGSTGTEVSGTEVSGTEVSQNAASGIIDEGSAMSAENAQGGIPDRSGSDPFVRTSGDWFNSPPLTLEGLKGSVVLVDFWTYSCINCLRTMPYLKLWHSQYASSGLAIVGVHSPEFAFERDAGNLADAIESIGIEWPVVQDNDFGIWNAFSNRYWPAHYLFDRDGNLASTHFGEGAYEETEKKIQELLGFAGNVISSESLEETDFLSGVNPETYLGKLRGKPMSLESGSGSGSGKPLGKFEWKLEGEWTIEDEYIEPLGKGILSLDFNAREVFVVISLVDGKKAALTVTVDGELQSTQDVRDGILSVDEDRLYRVFRSDKIRKGVLRIEGATPVRLYAFTFS